MTNLSEVQDQIGPIKPLTDEDRRRLLHPLVGGVILYTRNYADPGQLMRLTDAMSALSAAISAPVPTAMPTSAEARAGASLIPSPTIATACPPAWAWAIDRSTCRATTPLRLRSP